MQELATRPGDGRRLARDREDHVRKLFWALWARRFGREVISGVQIEEFQGLAREVHETRKRGIYFDPEAGPLRDAISGDEAENMLRLVGGAAWDGTQRQVGGSRPGACRRYPLVHGWMRPPTQTRGRRS